MLEELRIRNLAVVEDVVLTFGAGLNALTGSTGAGKSLILGAVNLLLGGRGSAQAIRAGTDSASVEGVFRVAAPVDDVLIAAAAPGQEKRITLRREVDSGGRSRALVNGRTSTLKQLQDLSTQLIEPHGQNEQLQLKQVENHIVYLDRFANSAPLLSAYAAALEDFQTLMARIADFEKRVALAREKKELLEHRVSEISQATPRKGEKAELEESLRVLAHAHEIFEVLREGGEKLYEDESSAVSRIAEVRRRLDKVGELDRRLEGFAGALEKAEIQLTETASEMRAYGEHLEFEPEDLERKQERLDILVGLERRYKMPVDDLIDQAKAWAAELDALVFEDEERVKLGAETAKSVERLRNAGVDLSALRRKAARELDRLMTREIGPLMLKGARFRTHIALETDAGSELTVDGERVRAKADGFDHVVFRFQANPGEAEADLSDSASSGELSRLALALKTVASTGREGSVLVFDEIDQGVGADMGDVIASKLEALSRRYQVICITHMPQIAARSDTHLVVRKATRGDRTVTEVVPAHGDGRIQEIARMLGGETGSDKRTALAREMLHLGKDRTRVRP
jgi:DNA repair protein RecN (Recombination protein N)